MSRAREVSAGLLVYRRAGELEILLAHPGGPYWAKKDDGAWTIPKGLMESGDLVACAGREFAEETGLAVDGPFLPLAPVRQKSGKIVHAFAVEADLDLAGFRSNTFTMEWPPRSGKQREFPDRSHRLSRSRNGAAKDSDLSASILDGIESSLRLCLTVR